MKKKTWEVAMTRMPKRSGSRGGTLRIEAARINVKTAVELGRTPDPRIVEIAKRPMSDNDTYRVENVLKKPRSRLAG